MVDRLEKFLFNISEISKYWHKIAADEMGRYGLKGPSATYLTVIYRHEEGVTAPQLCEICGKDKADVSRMMSEMEEKGLIKKEGANYRGVFKLTKEGKKAAEFVCERAKVVVGYAGKELEGEKRIIFYEALESIASNLKRISKEGVPEEEMQKECGDNGADNS